VGIVGMVKTENKKRGKIVVVSGPSGVGKSTICKEVVKRLDNACLSISVTTRPQGPAEVNGRDYWFISEKEFKQRLAAGLFLEHAKVFGHLYGTPKDKIAAALESGKTVILEIDVQGGKQVKAIYPGAIMIFVLPPSEKTLAERLWHRGRDNAETTETRLDGASNEIAAGWQYYENMVINEDLQQAVKEVIQIIQSAPTGGNSTGRSRSHIGGK
jgi:guanylate kinase